MSVPNRARLLLEQFEVRLVPDATIPPLEPGIVAGRVWFDSNANGLRDPGEAPATDLDIEVFERAQEGLIAAGRTDAEGQYQLPLPKGDYTLKVDAPAGFQFTTPGVVTVLPADNSDVARDSGMADFSVDGVTPATIDAGLIPVLPVNARPTVAPLAPIVIAEGQPLALHLSATDPDGDPLTVAWDLNGDGVFRDVGGINPTLTWGQLQYFGMADSGPARPIAARVSDGKNPAVVIASTVAITNVAPTATLTLSGTVTEGGTGRVLFGRVNDPSAPDRAAGFRFSYDLNNDGKWDIGDGKSYAGGVLESSATLPPELLRNSGSRVVKARLFDKDGGWTDVPLTVTIRNAAPRATFKADGPVLEGSAAIVRFSGVSDPSPADSVAGFRFSFDFNNDGAYDIGDGKTFQGSARGMAARVPATLLKDNGTYPVRARVFDKDGGSAEYIAIVRVTNDPPSGDFKPTAPVVAGTPAEFQFTATDRGTKDMAAGFAYRADFNGDGYFEQTSREPKLTYTFRTAGTYQVRVKIADKDGGTLEWTLNVVVMPKDG